VSEDFKELSVTLRGTVNRNDAEAIYIFAACSGQTDFYCQETPL
jgi:hypothetical protein